MVDAMVLRGMSSVALFLHLVRVGIFTVFKNGTKK